MRRRQLLVGSGLFVAALVGAVAGFRLLRERSVARAFGDLRACLIGEPLAAGERVGDRVFAIEAALDLELEPARIDAWPRRCGEQARRLEEVAEKNGLPELGEAAAALANELKLGQMGDPGPTAELSTEALERALEAGRSLEGRASTSRGVVVAPAPARALVSSAELRRAAELYHGGVVLTSGGLDAQAPDSITLRGPPRTCVLELGKPELTCGEARPERGQTATRLQRQGARYRAVRGPSLSVELPESVKRADVIGQSVIALEAGKLTARRILPDDALLGPAEELAELGDGEYRPQSCVTQQGSALAVSGWVALEKGGAFSKAVRAELPEGMGLRAPGPGALGRPTLSCRAGEASLGFARVSLRGGHDFHEVFLVRCTQEGCRAEHVELGRLGTARRFFGMNTTDTPDQIMTPLVVDLGQRVLCLWVSRGALRLRSAPLAELPRTPTTVLAVQVEGVGFDSDLERADVVSRGDRVVLSIPVVTSKGQSSLVVLADADGAARALLPP